MANYAVFKNTEGRIAVVRLSKIYKTCIVLAVVTAMLLSFVSCSESDEEKARLDEYELKLADLVYQKQQLILERDGLDTEMKKALGNTSYMSFIFTQIDTALYTDVYPAMTYYDDVKLVGVMAFSLDEIPGTDGNITVEQYNELISLGWGDALYWNGEGEISEFIVRMNELLTEAGIELPTSLMYAENVYTSDNDELLLEHGIENIIHCGGEDLDFVEKSEPDGAWHPGCIGWRWLGKSPLLKRAVQKEGGYALFEVNFDNTKEDTRTSYFPIEGEMNDSNRPKIFGNMVRQFVESIKDGDIEVYNVEDTRARIEKYYCDRENMQVSNDLRREEIKKELQAIEHLMMELYYEYH